MKKLKDYQKDNFEKLDAVNTSITIDKRHLEFIKKMNLNFSKMIRDYIDDLIKGVKNEKK